jgi:hypothetical protein
VDPTLPIPNRVLKRLSADNNALATECEDRSRPEQSAFFVAVGWNEGGIKFVKAKKLR